MKPIWSALALAGLVLGACGGPGEGRSSATPNPSPYVESPTVVRAGASLTDAMGIPVGLVTFRESRLGVRVEVRANGLSAGNHALLIHEGSCKASDAKTVGRPFNPNGGKHGIPGAPASQAGDLGNISVAPNGTATFVFYAPSLSLNKALANSLLFGPTSVVVHQYADDFKTDPDGNSGPALACGPVKAI